MIGFIITAVGIPIFGVAAIGITHSDGLQTLSGKVGKGYGIFFTCLLYLTIGPLFAIPRCATVSFTPAFRPMLGSGAEWLYLLIFSACSSPSCCSSRCAPARSPSGSARSSIPIFLIFLAVLMIAALLIPAPRLPVEPTEAYRSKTAPSSLAHRGLRHHGRHRRSGLRHRGHRRHPPHGRDNDDAIAEDVLSSGFSPGLLMALIYVLSILVGAQSRGLFELSENGGIALTQIAGHYLGGVGQLILAVTITFACLKTSIGLVTACSETFVKMTNGKFFLPGLGHPVHGFSFAVSNVGLSAIIEYSIPCSC